MNILVFTSLFPNNQSPNHGIFIRQRISQGIKRHGWNAKVVAPVPYFPPGLGGWRTKYRHVVDYEVQDGMEVWHPRYVMIPKIGMILQGLFLFVSVVWKVRALNRQYRFSLIDAHYVYPDGFAAILLSWIIGVPVVVSARGSDVNLFKDIPVVRQLIRWTLRQADSVIVVSNALKQVSVSLGIDAEKIRVIPNGVDSEKFFNIPQAESRRKIGVPDPGHAVLVSVCHLTVNKGLDVLLEALSRLKKSVPALEWTLLIVGDGLERPHLEGLAGSLGLASHVNFCGAVPHDQLVWFYNAADVSCLLSEREGWPNVIVESLACGTPVVATPVGGIPEILSTPEVGILVSRTSEQVAVALGESLNKIWSKTHILNHAKMFDWGQTADAIQEVFHSLVSPIRKSLNEGTVQQSS